jgi:Protein trafficking PGA2
LIIIIGGYLLLRPILVRYGAKLQERQLQKESSTTGSIEGRLDEKRQDKEARDKLQWGTGARIRQRKAVEKQIRQGEESDSDELEELLEK